MIDAPTDGPQQTVMVMDYIQDTGEIDVRVDGRISFGPTPQ